MKVLQFSGGLDSLVCLDLLKNTRGLTVFTISTDGAYPERDAYMKRVAEFYPHLNFVVKQTHRELDRYGAPVDVVPIRFTTMGNLIHGTPVKYQPYTECCARAIWLPMHLAVKELGATVVYRGQRADDEYKAPIKNGHVEDGITYQFPIEQWSRESVVKYVENHCPELMPEYYQHEESSRDCWDCTAYLKHNKVRIGNLPAAQKACVVSTIQEWYDDIVDETRW